jgi:hypothetical protein
VLKVPNASLRFKPPGWTEPPKTSALEAGPLRAALESLLPAAQAQGQGGGLQAYRERLERDLALTDAQKASVDGVFSSMRERFMGLRDLEPSERAAASEKLRNEMRSKVAAVLDPGQKKTFAAINAEIDARRQAAQAERAAGTSAATGASSPASGTSAGAGTGTNAPAAAPSRNAPAATSATAGAGASAGSAAAGAVSASPSPSAAAPKSDAKPSTPAASGTGGAGSAGGATGGGGPLRAFRDRLERDLAFTESQRGQLDGIFSAMRERFATVREAPEADRPKLTETYRAELRARINDILDETQKKKYAEILVELAGRNVSRGRVFIAGPDGKPMPVDVRLGLSDGVATELIGTIGERKLAEGDLVYVGVVGAASKPGPATPPMRPAGPRL